MVNWNCADETLACIRSLGSSRFPTWRIYIVDNASTDSSVDQIRVHAPEVELILSSRNLGYAGGFNLAWPTAILDGADFIWLLNCDTLVAPSTLEHLIAASAVVGPAIFSPQIRYLEQREQVWYLGGLIDRRMKTSHRTQANSSDGPEDAQLLPTQWATGCSLYLSAEALRTLGPMDERYFLYLEDVDWSLRAQRMGVPTYCVPKAILYHGLAQSVAKLGSNAPEYYGWRNHYLLVSSHGSVLQRLYASVDLGSRLLKSAARLLLYPSFRKDAKYMARTRGLIDFSLGRFGRDAHSTAFPRADEVIEGAIL